MHKKNKKNPCNRRNSRCCNRWCNCCTHFFFFLKKICNKINYLSANSFYPHRHFTFFMYTKTTLAEQQYILLNSYVRAIRDRGAVLADAVSTSLPMYYLRHNYLSCLRALPITSRHHMDVAFRVLYLRSMPYDIIHIIRDMLAELHDRDYYRSAVTDVISSSCRMSRTDSSTEIIENLDTVYIPTCEWLELSHEAPRFSLHFNALSLPGTMIRCKHSSLQLHVMASLIGQYGNAMDVISAFENVTILNFLDYLWHLLSSYPPEVQRNIRASLSRETQVNLLNLFLTTSLQLGPQSVERFIHNEVLRTVAVSYAATMG